MKKILLLSRYDRLGASSRLRTHQYIPYLESRGFEIDVEPLFSNKYIELLNLGKSRKGEALKCYLKRLKVLFKVRNYDLIWLEKELFSYMLPFFETLFYVFNIPYIVDYDDAIFHRYDCHKNPLVRKVLGRKIDSVMKYSSCVVAGNNYLAEHAENAGSGKTEIVPTVIDIERYTVSDKKTEKETPLQNKDTVTIGWIGSKTTTPYLKTLFPVFEKISEKRNIRIAAVGAYKPALENPGFDLDIINWSEEKEVSLINSFDIGVMPLPDGLWEKGKCGYKLIQYMGCSLPVVSSPVGVNNDIVEEGVNGFFASDDSEWEEILIRLIDDEKLRKDMGMRGRKLIEEWYCMQVQAPRLEKILLEAGSK